MSIQLKEKNCFPEKEKAVKKLTDNYSALVFFSI